MVNFFLDIKLLLEGKTFIMTEVDAGGATSYEEIGKLVDVGDGVTTVEAWQLRIAEGAGRLTTGINKKISKSLSDRGYGHVPFKAEDLPTSAGEQVRVYNLASAVGEIITAAHNVGETADEKLRDVNGVAASLLDQVRTLLA